MSFRQTFNPSNRSCQPGKEGCPACVSSLRHTGHQENFNEAPEELAGLTHHQEEALGLCLIAGNTVTIGDSCQVSNDGFEKYTQQPDRLTLKSSLDQLPSH